MSEDFSNPHSRTQGITSWDLSERINDLENREEEKFYGYFGISS